MRRVALGLLAFSIALAAVARSDDAKHSCPAAKAHCPASAKCCEQAAKSCQAAKCCEKGTKCWDQVAKGSQVSTASRPAEKCKSRAGGQGPGVSSPCCAETACAAASTCDEECEEEEIDCHGCRTSDKIAHLETAAEHLRAAGLETEAAHVLAHVNALKRTLLAQKLAELERLQAEVRELRQATGQTKQVLVRLQIVEVSLTNMRKLGFKLPSEEPCPCEVAKRENVECQEPALNLQLCDRESILSLVNALKHENIAKVLAEPTLVTTDGRPASYLSGGQFPVPEAGSQKVKMVTFGTQVDLFPTVLSDRRVRLEIRPHHSALDPSLSIKAGDISVPGLQVHEVAANCEVEIGQTAVIGGAIQKRISKSGVNEVQTLFLVTPELVNALPPTEPPHPCPAPPAPTAKAPPATLKK